MLLDCFCQPRDNKVGAIHPEAHCYHHVCNQRLYRKSRHAIKHYHSAALSITCPVVFLLSPVFFKGALLTLTALTQSILQHVCIVYRIHKLCRRCMHSCCQAAFTLTRHVCSTSVRHTCSSPETFGNSFIRVSRWGLCASAFGRHET